MLRSEINELEKYVDSFLFERDGQATLHGDRSGEIVAAVKALCVKLKFKWTRELLSNAREQVIQRYVQFHQAGIIRLSDKVSQAASDRHHSEELNAALEDILCFFSHYFYRYFDLEHTATIYYTELINRKAMHLANQIRSLDAGAVDPSLINCVLLSVNDLFAQASYADISYRQAGQGQRLLEMTRQLLEPVLASQTEDLVRALYRQNMNSLRFYNWYRNHLFALTGKLADKKQRQFLLREEISFFSGLFVKAKNALQPELPSLDVLIISWLQAQLSGDTEKRVKTPGERLPLNISVPQFALFIRLFYKTGCFPVENVAMIIRFFTEHFTTKKQTHISPKSFGRAFYDIDQSAAAVVRDLLQKMLNYLNKTYFP